MKSWTYEKAGVPPLKGDRTFEKRLVKQIRSTHNSGVMGNSTGFASLYDLRKADVRDPILVTATDGVGTKLEIARLLGCHNTIGIDLVAMCVNDLITCGAKPLTFLDYFAAGKFNAQTVHSVIQGIVTGCKDADCALVGGETAIMPGFYNAAPVHGAPQYDLAGFSVGIVERKRMITGAKIKKGDVLLGLASSGIHSNGYSLIRKIFSKKQLSGEIGKKLLKPTRIYVRPVLEVAKIVSLHGIVNITGGGFEANAARVIPKTLGARIYRGTWKIPKLFKQVKTSGNISEDEMYKTFNMGIGMILILNKKDAETAQKILKKKKLPSWIIGEIIHERKVEVV